MKRFHAWRRRRIDRSLDACDRKIAQLSEQIAHHAEVGEPVGGLEQLRVDVFWRRNDLIARRNRLPMEAI